MSGRNSRAKGRYVAGERKRKRVKDRQRMIRSSMAVVSNTISSESTNFTAHIADLNDANNKGKSPMFGGKTDVPRVPLLNSPELQLRFLNPSDVPEVKRLCQEWFPIEYPDSWYEDITSDERYYSVCAIYRSKVIGIIVADIKEANSLPKEDSEILAPPLSTNKSARIGYILSLGVVKEFRKNGVASFLLDNLVAHLTNNPDDNTSDVKALYLHVLTTNTSAISFYENRGFRPHVFLPFYYLIKGSRKDGFTYVLYINGGHPSWTVADYIGGCFHAVIYAVSVLNPWFLTKAVARKAIFFGRRGVPMWNRVRQIAHSSTAAIFS